MKGIRRAGRNGESNSKGYKQFMKTRWGESGQKLERIFKVG